MLAAVALGLPVPVPAAAQPVSASASVGVGVLDNRPGDLSAASDPGRYGVAVVGPWDYDQVSALKAANPNVKVLLYKDVAATASYDVVNGVDVNPLPTGVGYAYANTYHPDWFLTSTTGQRVQWADYPGDWWMDIGNPSYQDAWAANVIASVRQYGAAGVMMDDVDAMLGGHLPAGVTLAKYPTDASYAAAMTSFLTNVSAQLRAAGVLVVANIAFNWSPTWETLYKQWVGLVDGRLMEFWTKPGETSAYPRYGDNNWTFQIQQAQDVLSAGKMFIPVTYGDMSDTVTQSYARASFLLVFNGGASSEIWTPSTTDTDPWTPYWTASIGVPTGAATQLSSGAWERAYSGGLDLVNPSTTSDATVSLPGSFTEPDGSVVSGSVVLAPTTGLVLAATAGPTASASTAGAPRLSSVPTVAASAPAPMVGVIGPNRVVYLQAPGSSGWQSLGGQAIAPPALVRESDGALLVIANSTNHRLYLRTLTSGWQLLDTSGYCLGTPAATIVAGTLEVACTGGDRHLYAASASLTSGGSPVLGGWRNLAGSLAAGPAVAPVNGALTYFATGTNGLLYVRTPAGGYQRTAMACQGHPAAATTADGTTYVACQGPGGALSVSTVSAGHWSAPKSYGGLLSNGPGIAVAGSQVTFVVQGIQGTGWVRSPASNWAAIGGRLLGGASGQNS